MKRFKIVCIVFCVVVGFFSACKKDDFTPPAIQTLSVEGSSPKAFKVIGNISKVGSETVEDYGFVYSNSPQLDEKTGIKVSLGKDAREGEFSKQIFIDSSLSMNYNNMIWVRSYLRDSRGTVFGTMLNVNLPRPAMGNITPRMAMSGEIIKISGNFFDASSDNTLVMFQNVKAKLIAVSNTEITAEVPTGIPARHGNYINVSVRVSGIAVGGDSGFQILANIKDFTPKSGPVGTALSFIGDNMPDYYSYSDLRIEIGDQVLNNYYSNTVNVPFTVKENSDIAITINGKKNVLGSYKVTAPIITDFDPNGVFPGQGIIIHGTNFPVIDDYSDGRARVKLGSGGYQNVSRNGNDQYYYTLPSTFAEGEYSLYMKVGPHEVLAPKKLKVLGYAANSFSPSSGSILQQVNIAGSFIKGSWYNVSFGSITTSGTATSSSNLQVVVPYGVAEGHVKISVEFPDKKVTIPGEFEIVGPSFKSFSPASAVPGTTLTIKGEGFIQSYDTMVKFGSIAVAPNQVSANTILVTVPSNVSPGAMKLTVVTGGQSVTHKDNFTLLDK